MIRTPTLAIVTLAGLAAAAHADSPAVKRGTCDLSLLPAAYVDRTADADELAASLGRWLGTRPRTSRCSSCAAASSGSRARRTAATIRRTRSPPRPRPSACAGRTRGGCARRCARISRGATISSATATSAATRHGVRARRLRRLPPREAGRRGGVGDRRVGADLRPLGQRRRRRGQRALGEALAREARHRATAPASRRGSIDRATAWRR